MGGISYLTLLAQYAGTSAYIEEYVYLVKEKSILRRMINAAQGIEKNALEEPADVHATLDEAQAQFFQISQSSQNSLGVTIKDHYVRRQRQNRKCLSSKNCKKGKSRFMKKGPEDPGITGIPTHFIDLDKMLNGFMPSNFILSPPDLPWEKRLYSLHR